jgi:hypothetical protein
MIGAERLQKVLSGVDVDLEGLTLDNLKFIENVLRELYNSESDRWKSEKVMNSLQRVFDYRRKNFTPKCGCCGGTLESGNHAYMEITNVVSEKYLTEFMLYCEKCAANERSGKMFYGVEKQVDWRRFPKQDPDNLRYMKNGCLIVFTRTYKAYPGGDIRLNNPTFSIRAYTSGGSTVFPIRHVKKNIYLESSIYNNPEVLLEYMWNIEKTDRFMCTSCEMVFPKDKIAGYPLFAGRVCKKCWDEHLDALEEERKKGHVCGNCGRPYGDCCC